MNKTRRWLICAGAAVLLLGGGVYTVRHHQKNIWIAQQVFTVSMNEMRQRTSNGILEAYKLIPQAQKEASHTAYSVIYYPETHTALASVDLSGIENPQFYMVFNDGSSIKGWYLPELIKFNITHVAFEELESQEFAYLDFVEGAKLGNKPYDPAASDARLARFSLAMPPPRPYSWSNPAPSSSSATSSSSGKSGSSTASEAKSST